MFQPLPQNKKTPALASTTTTNELAEAVRGLGQIVTGPNRNNRRRKAADFCLVLQNGTDPDGNPMYDIYDLDDTDHANKLNVDPVVPENWRSADLTYTAGTSGIYQVDADQLFFLAVWDEAAICL